MTELAEGSSPQPSCDQAGQVHGFLSFPFCKMRMPIRPGCLGRDAKQEKPHCLAGCKWGHGRDRAASFMEPALPDSCLVQSGGAAHSPQAPSPQGQAERLEEAVIAQSSREGTN